MADFWQRTTPRHPATGGRLQAFFTAVVAEIVRQGWMICYLHGHATTPWADEHYRTDSPFGDRRWNDDPRWR